MPRRKVEEWFWQVGNDLQRLNEELVRVRPAIATGRCWEPKVDFFEDTNYLIVLVELAGVRGDEISVIYLPERHSLLIRGVRQEDGIIGERTGFYQLEINYGEFQREVGLPDTPLDVDGIRAQYRNGMLTVLIPKGDRIVVTTTVTVQKI